MHIKFWSQPGRILILQLAVTCGCSSSSTKNEGPTSTDAGDAGATCTMTLSPGADDQKDIQAALDTRVHTGDIVCFAPGTYEIDDQISLSAAANVTFRGTGPTREDVILDFATQTSGDAGISVTTDGFTIENLWIKNTSADGIKVQADNSTFDNIKVGWDQTIGSNDAGPLSGGYAIYPTGCVNTVIENCEVYGSSDSGVYAGQCDHVIAHDNEAHNNVLGIEVENSIGADVYDNDVHDNTTGILLDRLPFLQQKVAEDYHVHDNKVHDNNGFNFAAKNNTLAATAPTGTGILVFASTQVDISKNTISNNGGVAVLIASFTIINDLAALNGGTPSQIDPTTPQWPYQIYVHDNVFTNNGTTPQGAYALLNPAADGGTSKIPYDVAWDGILNPDGYGDAGVTGDAAAQICLGATEQQSFVNFHGDTSLGTPSGYSTDVTAHKCTLDIPALSP